MHIPRTHHPFKNGSNVSVFSGAKSHIVKKPHPVCLPQQCEVLFGHKGRVFVIAWLSVAVPDSKLSALLLFSPYGPESRPSSLSTGWPQLGAQLSLAGGHTGENLGGFLLFTCL